MTVEQHITITAETSGIRLDRYLAEQCKDLTRTRIQKLVGEGHITVNGKKAKPALKLESGDVVDVYIPPPETSDLSPEDIPLKILYEDDEVLVIDKPAGLTVHPAPGHSEHTLVNAILGHFPHLSDISDTLRPGIVHRLDKDTSGVMVIAKTAPAQANLSGQFKERTVNKIYLVLVRGALTPDKGIIEANLGRDPHNRKKMAVVSRGREARTRYRVLQYYEGYTLLEIKLETGRTHQIRVHLDAIGYPVVGDETYGIKSRLLSRQFVHAHRLGFTLPSTGEFREFVSELPADLQKTLDSLR